MLLVFTSKELERIVKEFSGKSLKIEFLGENSIKIKMSGINVTFYLAEVKPRKLTFIYKIGSVVNFFVEKFMDLDKPGITWDKDSKRIGLDIDQIVKDKKLKYFFIRQLLFDTEKMILDFDLKENEKIDKA